MIFVQRLSRLHEAAEKLKGTGYYDQYNSKYNAEEMHGFRESYYRRLKDGNT